MKLYSLLKNVDCQVRGRKDVAIRGIAYRSTDVGPNFLFVAVPGLKFDGRDFIPDAIQRGASAVVFEGEFFENLPVALLKDSLKKKGARQKNRGDKSLRFVTQVQLARRSVASRPKKETGLSMRQLLAQKSAQFYGHPTKSMYLAGVTGTNGKTTLTYLMESLWQQARTRSSSAASSSKATTKIRTGVIGTINTRYANVTTESTQTTPESRDLQLLLAEMKKKGVTHVAMEVSSHGLEMHRVDDCHFDACLFTNLTQDHLDYHQTMAAYFKAKTLLFEKLCESSKKNRKAIINLDSPYGLKLQRLFEKRVPVWTYGQKPKNNKSDLHLLQKPRMSLDGFEAKLGGVLGTIEIHVPLTGLFNVSNVMASVLTASHSGLSLAQIASGLEKFQGVPGRMEKVVGTEGFRVFVDYAHTPDALKNVLKTLRPLTKGRVITVFGCGGDRDKSKRPKMGYEAASHSDLCIVTSDNPRSEDPAQIIADILPGIRQAGLKAYKGGVGFDIEPDRRLAIEKALDISGPGDVVLIAGKGHENYQIVGSEKKFFSDRQVVENYLGI